MDGVVVGEKPPNKRVNPTVSRVTPRANGSTRRAPRPAGYARRYTATESRHFVGIGLR